MLFNFVSFLEKDNSEKLIKIFFKINWLLMVSKKFFDFVCVCFCMWYVYVFLFVNCMFGIISIWLKFCVYVLEGKFLFLDFDYWYFNGVLEFM